MSNIDKIRQEIKRRHDYENEMYHKKKSDGRPNDGWAESLAIMGVLEELLSFIDSLPDEPQWKPSEEQMNELFHALIPGAEYDCDILEELYFGLKSWLDSIRERPEQK